MALNPQIDANGPLGLSGELFLINRGQMKIECMINNIPYKVTGTTYLSNFRMIFVAAEPKGQFRALDIPLKSIYNEKFNQPIFGSNYLSFTVQPVPDMGIITPFSVKLYFKNGGADTFLKMFWNVMAAVRYSNDHPNQKVYPQAVQAVALGTVVQNPYRDPSDPSFIYVQQPSIQYATIPTAYPVPVYAQIYSGPIVGAIPTATTAVPSPPSATYAVPLATQPAYPVQAQSAYVAQPIQAQPLQPLQPQPVQAQPQPQPVQAQPQPQPVQAQPQPLPVQPLQPQPVQAQRQPLPVYSPQQPAYQPPTYTPQPIPVQPVSPQPVYQPSPYTPQQPASQQPNYTQQTYSIQPPNTYAKNTNF